MPLRQWTEYSKERAQDRGAESAGSEQVLNQDPNQHMNREMYAVAKEVAKLYPFPPTPRSLAGPGGLSPPPGPPLCTQTLCTQTPTAMCDPRFDRVLDRLPSPVRTMVRRLRQPSAIWIRWLAGILLICGGLLSFLPILGLWMLPLGLMLLADDVVLLRSLRSRILDWIERRHPHWLTN